MFKGAFFKYGFSHQRRFVDDETLKRATVRSLETIGEATKKSQLTSN